MKSSPGTSSTRSKSRALLLFGPTGVGKTDLLSELSVPVEVINADSMQVYRRLDIGTAKPSPELLSRIPHHLVNICDPEERFHVGRFVEEANRLIPEIEGRKKLPVVSGGTAFYFKNLIYGLPGTPEASEETRRMLERRLEEEGLEALYRELQEVDAESARRIGGNDRYRILRALEVYHESGKPRSEFAEPRKPREDLRFLAIGLYRAREHLYRRINERVEKMFDAGLEGEVRELLLSGYGPETPAMRAIGYREFFQYATTRELESGRLGEVTRERVLREIQKNSRRYAKRQITFFSKLPAVRWLEPGEESEVREAARRLRSES
ncbi:MAG: tRNA (adenosine(37)-N6)-dimethylallyltransferase MiaA [Spirochaetaceae bacterium]